MPGSALAAGRLAVEFVDKPRDSLLPDMTRYEKDGVITAATGQLRWDVSREGLGFFTVNTDASKALVGFRPDAARQLGAVRIEVASPIFSGIYVTSLDPKQGLGEAGRALITAVARAKNTGMQYNEARDVLEVMGESPIRLEPIQATIQFGDREIESVQVLDHDGRRTGRTLEAEGGAFEIDGTRDRAIYYEVVFAE